MDLTVSFTPQNSFVMVGTVIEQQDGLSYADLYDQTLWRKALLQHHMQQHNLRGLAEVAVAPSVSIGVTTMYVCVCVLSSNLTQFTDRGV